MTVVFPWPAPTVEVLRYAGVPEGQVSAPIGRLIVLLAQRYGLDPALKHVEVIPARGGYSVYITADGWRFIADRSGELDGITFPDVSKGEHGWRATAHVWRKGCEHPFEGRAGCGFTEKHDDPEAVAMTRATRRALKNGFSSFVRVESEYGPLVTDDEPAQLEIVHEDADKPLPRRIPPGPTAAGPHGITERVDVPPPRDTPRADQAAAHRAIGELDLDAQKAWLARWQITDFGSVWSDAAVVDALSQPF